jgi:hypothetical protein
MEPKDTKDNLNHNFKFHNSILNSDENFDILKGRKRTLQKKYGINKEYIDETDMSSLIEKMGLTVSKEVADKIFKSLDVEKTGKVSLEKFAEMIMNAQSGQTCLTSDLLHQINEKLTTKSERIILSLKKLKTKALYADDKESLDELDW